MNNYADNICLSLFNDRVILKGSSLELSVVSVHGKILTAWYLNKNVSY